MLAGEEILFDDELEVALIRAARLTERYNATIAGSDEERTSILKELFGDVGEGVLIRPPLYCDFGTPMSIGAKTFINFGFTALDGGSISIGEDVQVGPHVQLLTATHPIDAQRRRDKWEAAKPITIGDNAWLGGGAIVLGGVTIGENAIIGAGAVVTKDVPANSIAAGNPARILRTL
jgi:maltose O-acetyltransferase